MPDLEELGGRLDRELPDVRWEGAATLRALGTRRRRGRAAALTAAAAVTVVAVGTWAVAGRPDAAPAPVAPPPSPRSSSPVGPSPVGPSPTVAPLIPSAALLQPEDVRPGYEAQNYFFYQPGDHPAWPFAADDCPRFDDLHVDAFLRYTAMSGQMVGAPGDTAGDTFVHTEARRFPGDLARAVMADVERVVGACALYPTEGGESSTEDRPTTLERSFAVLDRGFAGDESLLVRQRIDTLDADGSPVDRSVLLYAVVRVGDLVAITEFDRDDPQRMRALGVATAARLRYA
jgi:hypothetical protein